MIMDGLVDSMISEQRAKEETVDSVNICEGAFQKRTGFV
jgi:hypothetical protein